MVDLQILCEVVQDQVVVIGEQHRSGLRVASQNNACDTRATAQLQTALTLATDDVFARKFEINLNFNKCVLQRVIFETSKMCGWWRINSAIKYPAFHAVRPSLLLIPLFINNVMMSFSFVPYFSVVYPEGSVLGLCELRSKLSVH